MHAYLKASLYCTWRHARSLDACCKHIQQTRDKLGVFWCGPPAQRSKTPAIMRTLASSRAQARPGNPARRWVGTATCSLPDARPAVAVWVAASATRVLEVQSPAQHGDLSAGSSVPNQMSPSSPAPGTSPRQDGDPKRADAAVQGAVTYLPGRDRPSALARRRSSHSGQLHIPGCVTSWR